MAFSKSFQKGQIALSCQMCEESSEIKWRCLTCQSFMCSKCCKIHRKFKSSDKHDIVDIKDIAFHAAQSGTTPDFTNIKCNQHKDQKCCLYCKACDEIVCPMCIAKVHNKHDMVEISEGYQISLSKIKNMNSEVEGDILKFTSDVSMLESIRAERSHLTAEKDKIISHEKAVKDAIEMHTKKLLTDLDQKWKIIESALKEEETYAVKVTKDLETVNKVFNQAMDSNNASEVFKIASEESKFKKKPRKPVNTKFQILPRFIPGLINSSSVESIHGLLKEIKEQIIVQKVQIQVKEQYTTTFPCVKALVCCDDGSLWISDGTNKIIQNVKLFHGSIHVNKTINLLSPDMALTPSGDLLLSTVDTHLQIIPHTTGEVMESEFSVSPLITTAVHVSTDNKIIVGARERGPNFPASGPRQVVVMDMKGRHEHVHHQDNKKKPLFTYPYKITTDKDNNIYVIDMFSIDLNGRVVVLGQGGRVRGIYTGHPDINDTDNLFKPWDIVTTQSDNVIVSESMKHTIHILNNNAQCVQYLNTEHSGIKWPRSLYIDNRGFLFIGCNTGKNEPDNAKIHVVQLADSKI